MEDTKITEHFKLSEFTKSATATKKKIDNTPTEKEIENIKRLCEEVLEPIRERWGDAIIITSGYRCEKLNTAVKGAKNSSHKYGAAADIKAKDPKKNILLWNTIRLMISMKKIEVDQIIWEKGTKFCPDWIHISVNCDGRPYHQNQVLYMY